MTPDKNLTIKEENSSTRSNSASLKDFNGLFGGDIIQIIIILQQLSEHLKSVHVNEISYIVNLHNIQL